MAYSNMNAAGTIVENFGASDGGDYAEGFDGGYGGGDYAEGFDGGYGGGDYAEGFDGGDDSDSE